MDDLDDVAVSIKESPYGGPVFIRTTFCGLDARNKVMKLRVSATHSINGVDMTSEFSALLDVAADGTYPNGRKFLDFGVDEAVHHAYRLLQSGALDDQEDEE